MLLSSPNVDVHELIAWGLDEYPYRDAAMDLGREELAKKVERAQKRLAERECHANCTALFAEQTENINYLLDECMQRSDLQAEYEGLDWTPGIVDLRRLLAFQRRLVFGARRHTLPNLQQDNWRQLISVTVGPQRSTAHRLVQNRSSMGDLDIILHSDNPDLEVRLSPNAEPGFQLPLSLYGGSPFLEVAELRGRWFLRDGYHRAYRLLQAGIHRIPAIVIYTRTIGELGATEPWFFSEEQLFSERPPHVTDFLDEDLILRYERTALRKVIRIRVEASLQVFDETDEVQGDEI
jgi:hypothetical protein